MSSYIFMVYGNLRSVQKVILVLKVFNFHINFQTTTSPHPTKVTNHFRGSLHVKIGWSLSLTCQLSPDDFPAQEHKSLTNWL